MCAHGMCANHDPEWKNLGKPRTVPNPGIFGKRTYWMIRCCERSMARYKKVQRRQCQKCGRNEDQITINDLALCLCCGYHFSIETKQFVNSGYMA